jgi:hypothetical protein
MPNIVVQTENGPLTVDMSAVTLPDGVRMLSTTELNADYVHNSTLAHTHKPIADFDKSLEDRFKNWVPRAEAIKDTKVIQSVLAEHGGQQVDIDAQKQTWVETELNPKLAENEKLKNALIGSAMEKAAQSVDIADAYLEPMRPGKPSFVQLQFGDAIAFNAQLGYDVAHGPDGKPIQSAKATNERPFMDSREYFEHLSTTGALDSFKKTPRKNAGVPANGSANADANATKVLRKSDLSEEEAANYITANGTDSFLKLAD